MARDKDDRGRPLFSRGPNTASRVFGLDQQYWGGSPQGAVTAAPRPKFLFMVRFVRAVGDGSAVWKDGLSFAVKRMDRPTVSPQVQELNQYNKKRLIQTGFKYDSVNIEFHDTVDSMVSFMWNEYASYYFGEFRRTNPYDWGYDMTTQEFNDQGQGFGLTLPKGNASDPNSLNSSFFFSHVECYQFFGRQFLRYDLIHPRISRYDPDDMDYDATSQSHGIRMTLDYESVLVHNNNQPIPLSASTEIGALVGHMLDGDVYEPPGHPPPNILNQNIPFFGNVSRILTKIPTTQYGVFGKAGKVLTDATTALGVPGAVKGVLGSFGNFDFGGNGDGNSVTNSIMNSPLVKAGQDALNVLTGNNAINQDAAPSAGVNAAEYDIANSRAGDLARRKAALIGMGATEGPPMQVVMPPESFNSAHGTSQIGFRTNNASDIPPDSLE